jgi:hypothetical protein
MTMATIEKLRAQITYPRPTKLSDPWGDSSEALLEKLLATDDHEMAYSEFCQLFHPVMPAGHYEEVIYFLPLAFAYLADPQNDAYELIEALVAFTALHREELQTQGLLDTLRDCFQECLHAWTTAFIVERHHAIHLPMVLWTVHYLIQIEIFTFTGHGYGRVPTQVFPDIAYRFVQQLAENTSDPVKAAWFLAYAAGIYWSDQYRGYSLDKELLNSALFEPVLSVILNQDDLKRAAQLVSAHRLVEKETRKYWRGVFKVLSLHDEID